MAAQGGCPDALEALDQLCRRYWTPVYAYIRRRGYDACEAEDLTQSFIASFLESDVLAGLDQSKGRFRSLLLVSLKNLLATEWARSHAQKRGGGRPILSLDELAVEERYCAVAPGLSPDELYDKRWAIAVLGQAMAQLDSEEKNAGRGAQFKRLQAFLTGDGAGDNYRAAGQELESSSDAVAMVVHRLRMRFRAALRTLIGATVKPEHVEEEMRCLMAALRK